MDNQNRKSILEKSLTIGAILLLACISIYTAFFMSDFSYNMFSSGDIEQNVTPEKSKEKQDSKININTATAEELADNLTGVGPAIAQRIIEYRETHGGFSSVDELTEIRGIGPKVFEKIKDYITV